MRLHAEFSHSAIALAECPSWDRDEIALAGRSNVGKSSLINALTQTRQLARTSKTPGRTRALNFFSVGTHLALVDLPGFGYAKLARHEAEALSRLLNVYLVQREPLIALVLLVDSRRGPEAEEMGLLRTISENRGESKRPFNLLVVATKSDKLRRSERNAALERFRSVGVEPLMCSAQSGEGIETLRRRILSFGAS
jgi:GTP-binding protein